MIPYRDTFGNPITKRDAKQAAMLAVSCDNAKPEILQKVMGISQSKALRLTELLADAGVTDELNRLEGRVLIRSASEAVDAVIDQLTKGKQ